MANVEDKKASWHFILFSGGFLKGIVSLKMQVENNFIKESDKSTEEKITLCIYTAANTIAPGCL